MTGLLNPNSRLTGASWAAVYCWVRPVCSLRIATARLPGTRNWAKKVTEAAARRTRTAVTILTMIRRTVRAPRRADGRRKATGTVVSPAAFDCASKTMPHLVK